MSSEPCTPGVGDHGTPLGYTRGGCRGPACRRALADYTTEIRARRRKLRRLDENGRLVADRDSKGRLLPHGDPSTYRNWLCRCEPCTVANSTYFRRYKKGSTTNDRAA